MSSRKENVKQHYVPQSYYRNFSSNKKALKVFNHRSKKEYTSSIDKISSEKFFYDVDPRILYSYINDDIYDEQLVDKYIKNYLEDKMGTIWKGFVYFADNVTCLEQLEPNDSVNLEFIDYELITAFIIIQTIRTPRFRNQFKEIGIAIAEKLSAYEHNLSNNIEEWIQLAHNTFILSVVDILLVKNKPLLKEWFYESHKELLNLIMEWKDSLYSGGICIQLSKIATPFITSDNPVCIEWSGDYIEEGFNFISLPISSNVTVLFFDRKKLPDFEKFDQRIYMIEESQQELVENMNMLVTKFATECIYADITYNYDKEKKFVNGEINMKVKMY